MRSLNRVDRTKDRRGFTLVELAVVALIISILAALALPNIKMALVKARAVDAVADLQVLRVGVLSYLADKNEWPPDAAVGTMPTGLDPYLPDDFSFTKETFTINYDNWTTFSPSFIAVTVETHSDSVFGAAIVDLLGSNAWTNGLYKFTWVLEWVD